jgi:hypothetical protein
MKKKKANHGRVINFKGVDSFLRNNNGARAVACQDGGTYSILAKNGDCTRLFNSDHQSVRQFVNGSSPAFIPISHRMINADVSHVTEDINVDIRSVFNTFKF